MNVPPMAPRYKPTSTDMFESAFDLAMGSLDEPLAIQCGGGAAA